jgi:methionyl-tRNA synthetase
LPETKDSEFTWKDFQTKNNSELVGILGNFVNRVFVLTEKYFSGKVPQAGECSELKEFIITQREKISESIENFRFREAMSEMMNLARYGNKLLTDKEPWKTFKTEPQQTGVVLYDCLQIIANLAILCEPFLPFTSEKLFALLNIQADNYKWNDAGRQDILKPNHQLNPAALLFEKIEDEVIEQQLEKLKGHTKAMNTTEEVPAHKFPELKPEITIDDFSKIDLRVGTIVEAKKVEKADKLLQLKVDLGFEQRTILSGIAAFFKPEDIVGMQVCVVANLAPRTMRGIESKGMLLLSEDAEGKLHFVSPKEITDNGSIIR